MNELDYDECENDTAERKIILENRQLKKLWNDLDFIKSTLQFIERNSEREEDVVKYLNSA